jgi:alpha-amylase/alpha-mannosidase (GH57 family)
VRISKGASSALLLLLILIAVLAPLTGILAPLRAKAQGSPEVYSNFTVTSTGYLTVYLYGVPPSSKVLLWWGVEPYPQGPWYTTSGESGNMETPMTYNSSTGAFEATIGPFKNGTWVAYVFNVNGTIWINYDNHAFWNWNVIINPPMNVVGYTKAWVLPNGSIVITTIGRPPDTMLLWWGLTTGPQTGLPWYTTAGTPGANQTVMTYNPLWGNYTAIIGPFKPGQWVQWVYHDNTTGWWIHNSNVSSSANFAIQDVYTTVHVVAVHYSQLVYLVGQQVGVNVTVQNEGSSASYDVALVVGTKTVYNSTLTIPSGYSNISIEFPANFSMGFYNVYFLVGASGLWQNTSLPQLIVLNTTNRKPVSVVIVWNMHQPLYLEPNGTWGQPWVQWHTGQDLYWNGSLVGAYELQAMLLNEFPNLNVSIDFTPVLLYQWEAFLHQSSPTFLTTGVNVTHDINATKETIALYRKLVQEGRLQVLTVPFYHPLMAIEYDNGWQSDLLTQLLMGKNMTKYMFGVNANGAWTPEMAFNMGLPWLYADAGINETVLDYQAFVQMAPALTVVSGNLSNGPYGVYVVQNSIGQRIYVLFRDTNLSNMFGFLFFSQSPQLTQQELIDYLAKVYIEHPDAVVVIALDGENPIIFNPMPLSGEDLYAIYQALSEAEGEGWLVTQTVNQAIETHPVAAVLTNLPEESWATNLNNWNNGYAGKVRIWDNVSLAREYLVAFSNLLGMPISPVVPLSFAHAPNASVSAFEAMTGMPAYINVSGVTEANPLYMYYTMWNWLYVSEGSDWTWQAGPPNNGPQWFSAQPIVYDSAIVGYVRSQTSLIVPSGIVSHPGNNTAAVFINDSLGLPLRVPVHVIVVVDNGTANASAEVALRPGVDIAVVNDIYVKPGSQVTVYLYAPLNVSQLGSYVVPVSSYGLLIGSSTFEANQLTFNPSLVHIANSATSTLQNTSSSHSAPSSYYVWVIVALVIVAIIIAVTIGYLRV